jgi:parallel beta-helix repeat protein
MIFLGLFMQGSNIFNTENDTSLSRIDQFNQNNSNIKSSDVITSLISINGSASGVGAHNWTWAKDQGYVSKGNGSQGNPYIIDNLEIDCQNSHGGIEIVDSRGFPTDQIYFRIENNLIYNIGSGVNSQSAGIKLLRTQHGSIQNNIISSNEGENYGIHVKGTLQNDYPFQTDTSKDINISGNVISDTERGIYIETGCENITISNNTATSNSLAGIYVNRKCIKLTISNNTLSNNSLFGIADVDSNNHEMIERQPDPYNYYGNTVEYNKITGNVYGFYLARTRDSRIFFNNISDNSMNGMYISGSSWNEIANNTIENNQEIGIEMVMGSMGCIRNKLYRNKINDNGINAEELTSEPQFIVYDWWWNPTYWQNNWSSWEGGKRVGNEWGDYSGEDLDDDAIGDEPYNFTGNTDIAPIYNDGIEGHIIFINGSVMAQNPFNWTWASQRFWCSGTGMYDNPYTIAPNEFWDGKINAWGNDFGIEIVESITEEFRIEGITIINSSQAGIKLYDVMMSNAIYNTNISSNDGHGIYLEAVDGMNITTNIIQDNSKTGIIITNNSGNAASKNKLFNNIISNNLKDGIYIGKNSDYTNITGNIIENSGRYGVNINETTGGFNGGCNHTLVYNNVFRENIINANDNGTDSDWYITYFSDYGRGNDWDDYDGADGDDDGIGDIGIKPFTLKPYEIGGSTMSEDLYPIYDDGLEGTPLYIDAQATGPGAHNWTWASRRLFVSGTGESWDPYIIHNACFSGDDTTNAITINNSNGMIYFKIMNCSLEDIGDTDSGSAGIFLNNTTKGEIINNTFSTNKDGNYGIALIEGCTLINITNNIVESENTTHKLKYGIYSNNCGLAALKNIIDRNIIRNNIIGIFLTNCTTETNITNNEITDNTEKGILIQNDCNWINIYYNDILRNGEGIRIFNRSEYNDVIDNDIKENTNIGLYINSSHNNIYYNYFDNPTLNAQDDTLGTPYINSWFYNMTTPYKGNFWSNYTQSEYHSNVKDANDDGIGDIAYNITGSNTAQDIYPIFDDGHNGSKVVIDGSKIGTEAGSWQWTASRTWCTGSGTIEDPYIISGLRINGQSNGSCITVYDSVGWDQNFIIRNCILYNSSATESPEPAGGIRLVRVKNATIINNTLSNNNGSGIILRSGNYATEETANITIIDNKIENNNGSGIFINGSYVHDNLIKNNTIKSNGINGICIDGNAFENTIINNSLYNNTEIGIAITNFQPYQQGHWEYPPPDYDPVYVYEPWDKNYIINNTIRFGKTGIGLESSKMIEISGNYITQTTSNAIAIKGIECINITIEENTLYANEQYGINFGWDTPSPSMNNSITNNNISYNGDTGIILEQCDQSTFSDNLVQGNIIGIGLAYYNSYNSFIANKIIDNTDLGLTIFDFSCENNLIYGNNFTNNGINGEDYGINNQWCTNNDGIKAGNYWDDYTGNDTNDDGIGDTEYDNIEGFMEPKDYYPIWWDAPVIEIGDQPVSGMEYGEIPPNYHILINQGIGDSFWYEVNGTSSGIMPINPTNLQGPIDNQIWNSFSNGSITITFYVNDSQNELDSEDVVVTKTIKEEGFLTDTTPTLIAAVANAGAVEDEEALPWWLQAAFTGMISASAGLVIKISYSAHKRRKQLYRKIAENFNKIENIEKFLRQRLEFEDWKKLQDSWQQYKNNEISQKELIKSGRKRVGKRFTEIFTSNKSKSNASKKAPKTSGKTDSN